MMMARCPDGESLSYSSHNSALANGLYDLYNQACLLDVKLICNDSEIYAHKAVLAAGSQFFKNHLQYMGLGLAELQLSSASIGSSICAIDLKALIEYLYCGELLVSHARLGQVLALAHNLQIIGFHTDTPGGPPVPEFRLANSGNSYELPGISPSTINGVIHPVIPVEAPSSQRDPPRNLIAVKQLPQASIAFEDQSTYPMPVNGSLTQKLPEQLKPDVNLPGLNEPNNLSFRQLCKSQGTNSNIFGGKHISQGKNLSSIFESSVLEDNSIPYKEGSDYTRDIDLENVSKVGLSSTTPIKDGVRDCLVLGSAGAMLESEEQEDTYAVMLLEALAGDTTQDSHGASSTLSDINGLLSAEELKTSFRNNRIRRPSRNTTDSRARLKVKDSIGGISLHEITDSPSLVLNGGPSLKVKDSIGGVSLHEVTSGPSTTMSAGPSLKVKDSIGGVSLQEVTNGPQMSIIAAGPSLKVKDSIGGVSLQDMSQPRVASPQNLGINECSNEDSDNREWRPVLHNPLPLNTLSHNPLPHNPLPLSSLPLTPLPPQQPISIASQLTTICAQQIDINQEQSIICIEDPDIIQESSLPTDFSTVCTSLVFTPSISSEPHCTLSSANESQEETSLNCPTVSNVTSEVLENQSQIVPAAQSGLISNNSLFVSVPTSASTENAIESLEPSPNNQSSILTPQIPPSTNFFLQGSTPSPLVIQPSASSVPSASLFSPSPFTSFTDLSGQSQLFNPSSFSYTPSNDLSGANSIVQVPSSIVFTNANSSQTFVSVCTTSPTILVSTSPQKSPITMLTENINSDTHPQPSLHLPPPPPLMALPSNIFTTVPTTSEPYVSSSITLPSNNSFVPSTTVENIHTLSTTSTTSSISHSSNSTSVIPFSLPNLTIPLTTMPTTIHGSVSTPLCSSPLNSPGGYSIGDEYDGADTDDEDITFVGQNPPRNSPIAHKQILALHSTSSNSDENDSGRCSEGLKTIQKIRIVQPEQVEDQDKVVGQDFNNDISLFQSCDNDLIIQDIEKERKKNMYQICENEITNQEEKGKNIHEDNEKEQKRTFFQDIGNETNIPDDTEKEKKRSFDDNRANINKNTDTSQNSDLICDSPIENEFSCPHCLLKFKTVDEQNLHLWEQHQIGNGSLFKCEICEWSSAAHLALVKHAQTHINSSNTRNVCAVCGKSFKTRQTLRIHMKAHRGPDFMYKCMRCPSVYSQKFNLIKHLASVHQLDLDGRALTQKLHCPLCPYTAHLQYKIKEHIARRHCEDKPFKCDQCSYTSVEKTAVENHKRTHTKEKPYICHTCNFQAPTRSILARHKRTHTKEKPYSCSECGQQYADSKRLRDHMLKHNNIKPFMCHLCGYTCRRKDNLQLHLRKTHKEETMKNIEGTVVDIR